MVLQEANRVVLNALYLMPECSAVIHTLPYLLAVRDSSWVLTLTFGADQTIMLILNGKQ